VCCVFYLQFFNYVLSCMCCVRLSYWIKITYLLTYLLITVDGRVVNYVRPVAARRSWIKFCWQHDRLAVANFKVQSSGHSSRGKYNYFADTRISLQHSVGQVEGSLHCVNLYPSSRFDEMPAYDTIRDANLTCARKPAWVSLIYRTEPTTKNVKQKKTKSRKQICSEITVNSPGNPCSEYLKRKVLSLECKSEWVMEYQIMVSMTVGR